MRNLRIDELFIGAWVQRWMDIPQRLSCPMYVSGISGDGSVCLGVSGDGGSPSGAKLREVCPIQMDEESLRGFGFVRVSKGENVWMKSVLDIRLTVSLRQRHGRQECRRAAISGRFACWNEEIRYVHELQRWWQDKVLIPYGVELRLSWKGSVKETEEIG